MAFGNRQSCPKGLMAGWAVSLWGSTLFCLALSLCFLWGCQQQESTESQKKQTSSESPSPITSSSPSSPSQTLQDRIRPVSGKVDKLCLATGPAGIEGSGFNKAQYKGMQQVAEDYGLEATLFIASEQTEQAHIDTFERCLDFGADIIASIESSKFPSMPDYAQANPDVYVVTSGTELSGKSPNFIRLFVREDEAGFLVGYLAGLVTKSGIVAGVYGPEIPDIVAFKNGYYQGVILAAQERKIAIQVLSGHLDGWAMPNEGAALAKQYIAGGADVIFGAGGGSGSGAILAAAQAGAWVIGVDQDEYYTTFKAGAVAGADKIISSALKRIDIGVYDIMSLLVEERYNELPQSHDYSLGVHNGGVGFADRHEADLPVEIYDRVAELERMLASGAITTGLDPVTGKFLEP